MSQIATSKVDRAGHTSSFRPCLADTESRGGGVKALDESRVSWDAQHKE